MAISSTQSSNGSVVAWYSAHPTQSLVNCGRMYGLVLPPCLLLVVESENKKVAFTRIVGAEIVLRAEHGVTPESLERRARCHAAEVAGREHDPLAVADVAVRVHPAAGAFALQITSKDPAAAREILARSQRL